MSKLFPTILIAAIVGSLNGFASTPPARDDAMPGGPNQAGIQRLFPHPASVETCAGELLVPQRVNYALAAGSAPSPRLERALARTAARAGIEIAPGSPALLTVTVDTAEAAWPDIATDESYRLEIRPSGMQLRAGTVYGAIHGLTTLGQMLQRGREPGCVTIADAPRFPWRGLLIDSARHWFPLEDIKRQLDAMALAKLNVLHWHLADDQGFRVESLGHPALHRAGTDGNYYTQAQVRELVAYAADRGIRVMPEFDLPGHSRSWQIAYPQLSSRPGTRYYLYHQRQIFSDPLDPTPAENRALIASIVSEMSALFPDAYFHMGGDEVNTSAWEDNDAIQRFIEDNGLGNEHGLQGWFIRQYAGVLEGLGKIPVGWDEVAREDYPPQAVVHKWRTVELSALEKRHPIVLSAGFYLDQMQTAWQYYRNDPDRMVNAAGAHILGGEASAWAESMDPSNIDARIWPRTLAVAELLWSPATFTGAQAEQGLYARIDTQSDSLARLGLTHQSHLERWFTGLVGAQDAEVVIRVAQLSRPEMYASIVTMMKQSFQWPWQDEIHDQPMALDPFLDHLNPESLAAWRFNQSVERFLRGREAREEVALRHELQQWRDNHPRLLAVVERHPALRETGIVEVSEALAELADAGLAALDSLAAGQAQDLGLARRIVEKYHYIDPVASVDWMREQLLDVRHLFRPFILLQVKLPVQRGIAALVEAAETQH